jgi:hypothetical protein
MRDPGWYVIDREHGYVCLRGPYKHAETAGAVREEMERNWDDGDHYHPREDTRNLAIVSAKVLDEIENRLSKEAT